MAGAVALVWDLVARDQASGAFARVAKSADAAAVSTNRAATSAAAFGKKAGAALGAIASIDFAVHAVKAAAQFQRSMLQIQTLAGASAAEVRDMSKAVLGLAGATGQAPEQLATSLYHVESIGLRGKAALDVVKIAAEGAKIGMADLEETTNALTSTVASGIPGVENMSQAMGALIAIVGEGDMKFSDLNEALGSGILSVVKGYGLSIRDVGAALATFGDNNIRGADAATMLRMAVQALAVPAKAGKDRLADLGLSMTDLQKDMQEGGLNQALLDLNKHMKQAGVTSVEVGGLLTQIFGKRAGPGLQVLIGQIDRFEQKLDGSKKSADGFASKWQATQQTVGVMFDKLRAKFQVFEIQVGNQLLPVLSKLPAVFSKIRDIVGPTASIVGGVLVGAWHALKTVVSGAASALSAVGDFLASHKTLFTALATSVLAMWAAFKAYKIAQTALLAIDALLLKMSSSMSRAAAAMASGQAGMTGMSASSMALKGSLVAVGAAVGVVMYLHQKHARLVAADKSAVEAYTAAIQADNGALSDNVRAQTAKALGDDNAFAQARKMGIGQKELTDAVLGNAAALASVKAKMQDYKNETGHNASAAQYLGFILDVNTDRLGKAKVAAHDLAEATGKGTDEAKKQAIVVPQLTQFQKDYAQAQKDLQINLNGTTYAMKDQGTAADVLNAALARLSGDKNAAAESQLALADSLAQATDQIKQQAEQYKDNGTSLNKNTAEGRKNLEWLHQQIDQINSVASAQLKAGASTQTVTDTLGKNEQALRSAAVAAGLNKDQVDALIKKYAATPKEVETYIKVNSDVADTKALSTQKKLDNLAKQRTALIKLGDKTGEGAKHIQDQIDALTQPVLIPVSFSFAAADLKSRLAGAIVNGIGLNASGTENWRGGPTWVGEEGPELLNLPRGSRITSHPESMKAAAGGAASVTVNQTIVNPVPQTAGVSGVAGMRRAAYSISRLAR